MGAISECCCVDTCPSPTIIPNISFSSINKTPADWFLPGFEDDHPTGGVCCPFVHWDLHYGYIISDILLKRSWNYNNGTCDGPSDQLFCTSSYLWNMTFWFSKFSCEPDKWWVAMRAKIYIGQSMSLSASPPTCGALITYPGFVYLYREKFISSIAAPTTITFTKDDHYDWTSGGACNENGPCPNVYSGEISTTSYYRCVIPPFGTLGPLVNPVTVDFQDIDFSFGLT